MDINANRAVVVTVGGATEHVLSNFDFFWRVALARPQDKEIEQVDQLARPAKHTRVSYARELKVDVRCPFAIIQSNHMRHSHDQAPIFA